MGAPHPPRLGAGGAFSSDLEFLLSALKSGKEEARRYFRPPAVLNGEETPAGARRFVPLIANTPGLRHAKVIPTSRPSGSNLSACTKGVKGRRRANPRVPLKPGSGGICSVFGG